MDSPIPLMPASKAVLNHQLKVIHIEKVHVNGASQETGNGTDAPCFDQCTAARFPGR